MKLNDSTKVFRTFLNKGRKSGEKALKNNMKNAAKSQKGFKVSKDSSEAFQSARNKARVFESKADIEDQMDDILIDKWLRGERGEDYKRLRSLSSKGQKGFKVSKDSSEAFQSARDKARVFESKADIEDQIDDIFIDKWLRGESFRKGKDYKRLRSMSSKEFAEKVEEKQRFKFANNPANGNAKKYRVDTSEEGKKKIEAALKDRKAKVVDSKGNEKLEELVNKYKENQQKENGFLNKAVPMAIGGAVVFTLANRRGRQSNSQLYGQQGLY